MIIDLSDVKKGDKIFSIKYGWVTVGRLNDDHFFTTKGALVGYDGCSWLHDSVHPEYYHDTYECADYFLKIHSSHEKENKVRKKYKEAKYEQFPLEKIEESILTVMPRIKKHVPDAEFLCVKETRGDLTIYTICITIAAHTFAVNISNVERDVSLWKTIDKFVEYQVGQAIVDHTQDALFSSVSYAQRVSRTYVKDIDQRCDMFTPRHPNFYRETGAHIILDTENENGVCK